MSTGEKKHSNGPKQAEAKTPVFNPDKSLNKHLGAAMEIATALYGAAAIHVINGRLAYFNTSAGSGIS